MKWTKRIVAMHWIYAVLLLVGVGFIFIAKEYKFQTEEWRVSMAIHAIVGMILFFLVLLRIYWRYKDRHISPKQEILPKTIQFIMLSLLVIVGATGAIYGIFYGFFETIFSNGIPTKNYFSFIHHEIGNYFLMFLGLHVLGAFKFLLIKTDNLIKRMMF